MHLFSLPYYLYHQIPALDVLWGNCGSSSPVISQACCDALVSLVKHGYAEFSYILTGCLNLIPSVDNVGGITNAISRLLVLQLESDVERSKGQQTDYSCPYKLRFVKYAPLTSMLKILSDPIINQTMGSSVQISRFLQLHVLQVFCFLSVCHQINTK